MLKQLVTLILLFPVFPALLVAQDVDWSALRGKLAARSLDQADYRLGPGDLIGITVYGVESFNQELRVSSSGKIGMPFLGKIHVVGLSPEELEARLTDLIGNAGLIKNPQVSVFVKEYRSQPVYILGAVQQPGQYMMTHQLTLLDILTMAGGLDLQRADYQAVIQRRASSPNENHTDTDGNVGADAKAEADLLPETEVITVDLRGLLEDGELAENVLIQGGDVIQIPERKMEVFYVVGDVGRSGAFEYPSGDEEPLSITQALVWAGGPSKTAKMSKGILVRYDEAGVRQEMAVDFKAVLKGKAPNFSVQPDDIIFIPGSAFKTLGYGLLGVIPGTVQASVWRLPR